MILFLTITSHFILSLAPPHFYFEFEKKIIESILTPVYKQIRNQKLIGIDCHRFASMQFWIRENENFWDKKGLFQKVKLFHYLTVPNKNFISIDELKDFPLKEWDNILIIRFFYLKGELRPHIQPLHTALVSYSQNVIEKYEPGAALFHQRTLSEFKKSLIEKSHLYTSQEPCLYNEHSSKIIIIINRPNPHFLSLIEKTKCRQVITFIRNNREKINSLLKAGKHIFQKVDQEAPSSLSSLEIFKEEGLLQQYFPQHFPLSQIKFHA